MLIQPLSFHFSVDVWSVGCIMAEMVRGSVLFPGTDRILTSNLLPPPPPQVPSSLILIHILARKRSFLKFHHVFYCLPIISSLCSFSR